ncbi:MAG: MinD/ParA family protein [Pseudodesulfovibrio sp.]|uniref:Cobyrinic acid ac-diamide synthase n=1 Tax=Pseudodesulfovibrio aespoeensis (strain ATCC 700646 / DSM 10631 / Aspo-2) TaxID=643562 RepID=E6VVD3_PSEA9|nr:MULTISPECIES: MinD/ParA family protein [Pseudodesulfovibrio]MBU4243212.1 MinD/ParA family protein [Pseudomonadota bacterium]MCG2740487.1 MinD/ParA family protein [Syntrophaceae bacterium]ADU62377.1 cobyrinic acid ac-diamide synthase [Pseudodesulfovibrio aespoeensis Aspo-2]MBU4379094.1 MinD/ParA family protein [Pseudomonadota bacterium]MBU4473959.1 MinD/ParA family protein [Pseudomonadota bacterium]
MTSRLPLVLSVTSGKGGVGKTNMSVNLAYSLSMAGKNVVLLDADLGLANVDVILGLTPERNLFHLFNEDMTLDRILFDTPYGFRILPASSGVSDMVNLDRGQKLDLLDAMDALEDTVDYLIVDTGAGINDNVLYFNLAVQERLLVITPEPTSLTDAYALIKVLKLQHGVERFRVLVNMVEDRKTAKDVYIKLLKACDHFLDGISLDLVGFVPYDPNVRNSVIAQKPFCHRYPKTPASVAVRQAAQTINGWHVEPNTDGNIKFFWKKLLFQERSVA